MTITDRTGRVVDGSASSAIPSDPNASLAIKTPVRVATTANITLSGLQAIDGVTLTDAERVLVKDQTDQTTNGIYSASSGNWTRTVDLDGAHEVVRGTRVFVTSGTVNGLKEFAVTSADPLSIGTSSIVITEMVQAEIAALAALGTGIVTRTGTAAYAARSIVAPASGITITNGSGVAGNPTLVLANDLAALEALASTGLAVRSATDTWVQRSLASAVAGLTWTNGDGVSGNPTPVLANDLAALEGLASTGIAVRTATDTWAQRTITGTSNRVTVTNGDGVSGNPTLDISSAYVGQNTITTLGTIGTGTWQGTAVAVGFGGTGIATYAIGDILQASASTTLSNLASVATGNALISGGVGTVSAWGKIGLTTHVSGTLGVANGGTGITSFGTGVATALGVNVGSAGAPVVNGGALGTPLSGLATNLTGTASGLTAGNVTTNANLTGPVTSVGNATAIANNQITRAMEAQGVARSVIGVAGNATANVADIQGTTANTFLGVNAAGNGIGFQAVTPAIIGAVATVKKQSFIASGTYTPSTGMLYCIIECVGGGAGGGAAVGAVSASYNGGGGGSGGYSRILVTAATVGVSKSVTIGAAGAGGAAGSNNGVAGGATNVGTTICVANGGGGGNYASAAQAGPGGAAATAGTGDLATPGNPGFSGFYNSSSVTSLVPGGIGAPSTFGGAGPAGFAVGSSVSAGGNATGYGAGGGGASSNNIASNAAGGNGSAGVVFITEYCSQ